MFGLTLFEQPYTFLILILIVFLTILLCAIVGIYLHIRRKRQSNIVIAKKRLIYSSPASITPQLPTNRFVFPFPKLENTEPISNENFPQYSNSEILSNYKTFDLTKQYQRHLSSDSSYTSSNYRRLQVPPLYSFNTIKSKIQQAQSRSTTSPILARPLQTINSEQISNEFSSDSDEQDNKSITVLTTPSSLFELFRIELIYKLHYSIDDEQLRFQLIRLTPIQSLIESCFSSFICKIHLYTSNDKRKNKKYFSKKNPSHEIFKFDVNQYVLERSRLKIQVFGQHKNDKRLELGQTILILNQYDNLMRPSGGHHHDGGLIASEERIKSIPINEDRIDMITQQQVTTGNEARALISFVYEDDRYLLHVGIIKIVDFQSLLKQLSIDHSNHRNLIQIKISTIIDGKITAKRKSKAIIIDKNLFTFSTSFPFEYISLHKTSVRITIYYGKTLISSPKTPISSIEFGSTQLKTQESFQHWTDTISEPNRPHIHWHRLQPIDT